MVGRHDEEGFMMLRDGKWKLQEDKDGRRRIHTISQTVTTIPILLSSGFSRIQMNSCGSSNDLAE